MNFMLDLETLSTRPMAAIVSIGIAAFDDKSILDAHQWECEPVGHIDPPTIHWWQQQIEAGVDPPGVNPMRMDRVLDELNIWLDKWGFEKSDVIWGHPAAFDIVILTEAYIRLCRTPPWTFRQVRDLPTLRMLYPHIERPKPIQPHVASYDAMAQAEWVLQMMREHEVSNTNPDSRS